MTRVLALFTCFNRKEKSVHAVESLISGNPQIDFTFLVVDDGSTDGTAIRDTLYGVNYDGVTGSITFDQTTGDANKDMAYIKKAADGAFEFVKTQSVEG